MNVLSTRFLSQLTAILLAVLVASTIALLAFDASVGSKSRYLTNLEKNREKMVLLASTLDRLTRQINAMESGGIDTALWSGSSSTVVVARVQGELDTFANEAGLELRSVTQLGSLNDGQPEITFRVEGQAPYNIFIKYLENLNNSVPILIIDAASLRSVPSVEKNLEYSEIYFQLNIVALFTPEKA